MPKIDLASLAGMVQQYISRKYAAALIDRTKVAELKAYIAQYLYDTGFTVDGYTEKTLADRLYSEMAEYSVLTHYLDDPDVEEINRIVSGASIWARKEPQLLPRSKSGCSR